MQKTYRVFGHFDGEAHHRNALSFEQSRDYDWMEEKRVKMHMACFDETGSNDYVDLTIEADSEFHCLREVLAQESDGLFENVRTGKIIDLASDKEVTYDWCNSVKMNV